MSASHELEIPTTTVLVDNHVLMPREEYDALVRMERRAHEKISQLREHEDPTPDEKAFILVLAWLLGEVPW